VIAHDDIGMQVAIWLW